MRAFVQAVVVFARDSGSGFRQFAVKCASDAASAHAGLQRRLVHDTSFECVATSALRARH